MANRSLIALAAGIGIGVAGLVGGGISLASDDSSTPDRPAVSAQTQTADEFLAAVAAKLGVDVTALKNAIKETGIEYLDKAVADGKITQAMADRARAALEDGTAFSGKGSSFFGIGGHMGGGPGHMGGGHGHMGGQGIAGGAHAGSADLATFLGISEADLRTELGGGSSLAQVAANHGKSRDELKAFLAGEMDKHLAEAVSSGKLTQAQADAMKTHMTAAFDQAIDATPGAGMRGHGFSEHHHGGMPGMAPSTAPSGTN